MTAVLARMVALGLLWRPQDAKESKFRAQEWGAALEGLTEAEASSAVREISRLPATARRASITPGDVLEVAYEHRRGRRLNTPALPGKLCTDCDGTGFVMEHVTDHHAHYGHSYVKPCACRRIK